jgi:membrane protein DedA with SNARE-associated domain
MYFASLIGSYGYLAVFLGGIFEGEVILLLGGLAAHEGILSLWFVIGFAFLGTIIGDWAWFLVGRWKGEQTLARFPRMAAASAWPRRFIADRPALMAFLMRFMYGFRSVVPLGIGMSSIRVRTFALAHTAGAVLWSASVGVAGYFFGTVLEVFIGRAKKYELIFAVVIIAGILVFHMASRRLKRRIESRTTEKIALEASAEALESTEVPPNITQ